MSSTITKLKKLVVALFALLIVITAVAASSAAPAVAVSTQDFDAASYYKAKCAMCHGQKAEKKFDAAKEDAHHVSIVLKGKDDVTPKMPGYEAKGVTEDQAKALVAQMRSLKQ